MHKLVNLLILAFCWVTMPTVFAQYMITLKDTRIDIKPVGYHIAGVKDGRLQKNGIGTIITSVDEKAPLTISGGVKNGFQNFIARNLAKDVNTVPILYHIQTLTVTESRKEGAVHGKMSLSVSFERIGKNDTVSLVTSEVFMDYKRSVVASPNMNNLESVLHQLIVQTLDYVTDWMQLNNDKHEALTKGVEIFITPDYKKNDKDTIYYETRKINWDDFRGRPGSVSRYGAAIFSNFGYHSSFKVSKGLIQAFIETRTYMVRGMSWANETAKTEYSLAHEQLHFDITKLVVERFKKKVKAMHAESIDDLNSMIQYEYLESYREMNRLQKEYDDETRHSLDTFKQAEWAQKIKMWLKEYLTQPSPEKGEG
ncbi:DUF922 domain-containing protein [Emticicia agri]|uniref:DUF922 domain-containing protein n=1 Tax=Emticicia agri TaxID=2492393 RepID=A0A4Q5LTL3_9BACT|nr:hypothetical protein [Emticicia agri]RYU92924.1 hypothetical protein EWM59_24645 [Emticicia agri]